MAGRVIRGYWDCPQCGTKGIDGLIDVCPNCGSGKDKNVRYYMKSAEEVSDEELAQAKISKEESDGAHREWVCAYCGFLNNYAANFCEHCGAAKEEKTSDYQGDTKQARYTKDSKGQFKEHAPAGDPSPAGAAGNTTYAASSEGRSSRSPIAFLLLGLAAALLAFLFWPLSDSRIITGFEWKRSVTVEELQTFSESGWTLPAGARQTGTRMEQNGFRQVLDHYETVYETRSREVLDHYDISYEYTDNGNGTFSEHEVRTPVYRTEYYKEAVREPVYRTEPVYQTRYYYDIDRWVKLDTYETSEMDHDPYWSDAYTLADNQRDTMRTEEYYTIYDIDREEKTNYDTWKNQEIGDGLYVKKNRIGIEYSRKEVG